MTLPRNVYKRGRGYRGQRMIAGQMIRTPTRASAELAAAELAALVAGDDEQVTEASAADVLAEVIEQAERTTAAARRALVAVAGERGRA